MLQALGSQAREGGGSAAGTGFTGGCLLWSMCSLEAAYKLELVSLHGAVPQALGTQEATVWHALHSLAGAVLREVGSLETPVPWDLGSLEAAVLRALCSLHAA